MVLASIIAFVVSLLIGGLAIYAGARVVVGVDDYGYAVVSAVAGAIAWAIASLFFSWIPVVGWLVPLAAWVVVINWRYPGSWANAALIGLVAWVAALVVLAVLPLAGVEAYGVPFVD